MLKNFSVTAFTLSELLRENQHVGRGANLAVMHLKRKNNKAIHFLLCAIDIFSK